MTTKAAAGVLRLRLFVEGIEIPCIEATVNTAPNGPVVASLRILPLAEGTRFMAKSLVHIFFLDNYQAENSGLTTTGNSKTRKYGQSVHEKVKERQEADGQEFSATDINDYRLQNYKLVFCGELMGFGWTKTPTNRSLVLQCMDLSNYWDFAKQYNNTDLFGPGYKALFSGGSTNLFTDFLSSPGEIATKILMTPSTRYPAMRGLIGGLIHLLESMGGSYYYDKKYAGQNLFYSLAELRLHITQMITAYDKDPTSQRLMGGSYDSLFGRSIGSLGDQATFRSIVNKLAGFIFHETFAQPCPMYVPGTGGTISGFERKKLAQVPELAPLAVSAQEIVSAIGVVQEGLSGGDTDFVKDMLPVLKAARSQCLQNARAAGRVPQQYKSVGARMATAFNVAASNIGKGLSTVSGFKYTPQQSAVDPDRPLMAPRAGDAPRPTPAPAKKKQVSVAPNALKAVSILAKAVESLKTLEKIEATTTAKKDAIPAQLKQQIIRPDVWFSAPPRCNVIFPDQYMSLSFSRSFMQEPTRLLLKTHEEFFGEDELFDSFYFAPKAVTVKGEKNTLRAILKNDVLDHELFTGILPVFEKMGEFNILAAKSGVVDGKIPKIGLAQRSTNFLYFKYRFSARDLSLTMRFNPYIAVGFPGLIIDKWVDIETMKLHNDLKGVLPPGEDYTQKLPPLLGTHFLANFTEVSHNLSQQQATTSVRGGYARQAEETIEFLGAEQTTVQKVVKKKGEATRVSTAAALVPPRIGQVGPGMGRIVSIMKVTDKYRTESAGKKVQLLDSKRDKRTKQLTVSVEVAKAQPAKEFGPEVVELVGDENLTVQFEAFEITETVARTARETVFLPPEEYIRPGWYGDCWAPSKISDVYYDFFDTGAITEAIQVQNTDGTSGSTIEINDATAMLADSAENGESYKFAQDQMIKLSQTKNASVQDAVAFLVLSYSVIKGAGFDADAFIKSYTWRPIASVLDMFGSNDLMLSADGHDVVQGFEGFHSRAFGPFADLFGLVPQGVESVLGIQQNSAAASKADVRMRKRQAVLDYLAVIQLRRAILG